MSGQSKHTPGWLAHYRELLGTWRRRHPQDGEDAMQDAVLGLLERGAGYVDEPLAYLSRSTANGLIDRHRRRGILDFRPLEALAEEEHPTAGDAQSEVYTAELLEALMAALQALPPACQRVYIQHRLEGWTHAEIAADMGISRSMVEKHMIRALVHIDRTLKKYSSQ